MRLKGKVIIVTGAAGYIGRAFALRMGQEGGRVVVCDLKDPSDTAEAVRATGAEVLSLVVDVTSEESTKDMARRTIERFGRIDCLLNNAGLIHGPGMGPHAIMDVDLAAFDRTLAVNVKGPFLCTRAVFPQMQAQGGGSIINIGSGSWLHTSRGWLSTPHYVASKAAVTGLTRGLAKELGRAGIRINTLAPGNTPADQRDQLLQGPDFERSERALGRMGLPEDLTGTAVFLFSEDASFITGQMLLVNGGMETL
jgi:NAD(P)-dependent dehydrogenase (short-subunit alcohol dehydrogenase family)